MNLMVFWSCFELFEFIALLVVLVSARHGDFYCLNRNAVGKPTDVRDGSALHALTFQASISTGGKSSIQGTEASIQMVS
jgi:hypothetical protein